MSLHTMFLAHTLPLRTRLSLALFSIMSLASADLHVGVSCQHCYQHDGNTWSILGGKCTPYVNDKGTCWDEITHFCSDTIGRYTECLPRALISTCASDQSWDHSCSSSLQCGCGGHCDTGYCRQAANANVVVPVTRNEVDKDAVVLTTTKQTTTTATTGTTAGTTTTTTHAPCFSYFCAPGSRVPGKITTQDRDGQPPPAAIASDFTKDDSATPNRAGKQVMPERAPARSTKNGHVENDAVNDAENDAVVITVAVICGVLLGCSSLIVFVGVITYRAYRCCRRSLPCIQRAKASQQLEVSTPAVTPSDLSRERPRSYRDAKKLSRVEPEASEDTSRQLRAAANGSDKVKDLEGGYEEHVPKPPIVVVSPPSSTAPPRLPVLLGGSGTTSKEEV